jgi:hypothetical protein
MARKNDQLQVVKRVYFDLEKADGLSILAFATMIIEEARKIDEFADMGNIFLEADVDFCDSWNDSSSHRVWHFYIRRAETKEETVERIAAEEDRQQKMKAMQKAEAKKRRDERKQLELREYERLKAKFEKKTAKPK